MMKRARFTLLATALLVPAAAPAPPLEADTLRVVAGGRDSVLTVERVNGARMIEARPLVRLLGGTLETQDRLRFRVKLGAFNAELMPGLPFFKLGESTWPLSTPPALNQDVFYLPLQFVVDYLPRLVRDVEYDVAKSELRGAPAPVVADAPRPASPTRQRVVVVDAGHGGIDPGMCAVLPDGKVVYEKTITLGVAQKLRVALQDKGYKVVMTRDRDTLIALADRGGIANRAGGDLFLSIHVNSSATKDCRSGSGRGFETYFLSEARTEDERRVEAMENESIRFESGPSSSGTSDALTFLLNDMVQNEHLRESSELAETVQRHLTSRGHPGPNRGVKQAGYVVLVHAYMPSVLIETGFGSDRSEARWLASGPGQSLLANAIANAAHEYLRNYDRRAGTIPR